MLLKIQLKLKSIIFNRVILLNTRSLHTSRCLLHANPTEIKKTSVVADDTKIFDGIKGKTINYKPLDLSFENSEIAFKSKTNLELLRGLIVFYLCSIKYVVDNQVQVSL